MLSVKRVLAVNVGLMAVGAVCGSVLGSIAFWVQLALMPGRSNPDEYLELLGVGALGGVFFGMVLAPIVGWLFLRRVTFARAIGETSLGILLGIIVGAIINPRFIVLCALAGFVVAGMRLWCVTGTVHVEHVRR